jgi:preprotein translocase subunit SecB
MAENEQSTAPQGDAQRQRFKLQRIYVRDLSFESPNSPDIFQQQYGPNVDFNLNTKHRHIKESFYEVVLKLTAEAKHNGKTLFLVEVEQAGIFDIQGIEGQQLEQVLGSMCPGILFPYARETIDVMVTKGTFPPLMLDPVNFDAIYARSLQQRAAQPARQ